MKQSSIYIEPQDSDPVADDVEGAGPTIVHITNYYAGTEKQKVHNDFVRGGTDGSVLY
ncbi:MAG: hypothetical protein QGH60_19220 [Phycisphaerae bacterium]|jgi:hypothetical protein|nr:hypothetical protein [Phycisphaerae bacterium]